MPSYRKKHIKNKIFRSKPNKTVLKKAWFWLAILFVAIILCGTYTVLFCPGFQLRNIVIIGNIKTKTSDLQQLVYSDANTELINFLGIKISSHSIFLISDEKISTDILKQFPVIGQLAVNRSLPQSISINVVERSPVGIFCDNSNACFLIDNSGIVFDALTAAPSGTTIVRQVTQIQQAFAGEQVVSQYIINAISQIQQSLKDNFQISVSNALVATPVRLNIATNQNWQIYFDLSEGASIDTQLTKLNSLLGGGISADTMKNLRYIDLRPKDRAIVCDNQTCGGQQ